MTWRAISARPYAGVRYEQTVSNIGSDNGGGGGGGGGGGSGGGGGGGGEGGGGVGGGDEHGGFDPAAAAAMISMLRASLGAAQESVVVSVGPAR
jgi:hypothetical protein